jgi:hypothetical protein
MCHAARMKPKRTGQWTSLAALSMRRHTRSLGQRSFLLKLVPNSDHRRFTIQIRPHSSAKTLAAGTKLKTTVTTVSFRRSILNLSYQSLNHLQAAYNKLATSGDKEKQTKIQQMIPFIDHLETPAVSIFLLAVSLCSRNCL